MEDAGHGPGLPFPKSGNAGKAVTSKVVGRPMLFSVCACVCVCVCACKLGAFIFWPTLSRRRDFENIRAERI